jgi:hypothetical protein
MRGRIALQSLQIHWMEPMRKCPENVRIPGLSGHDVDKPHIGHSLTTLRGRRGSRIAAKEPIATTPVLG